MSAAPEETLKWSFKIIVYMNKKMSQLIPCTYFLAWVNHLIWFTLAALFVKSQMTEWMIPVESRKPTFGDIKVEEVTVEDSLDHTGHYGDHVKEALKVETPDPVEEIQGPIQAQTEQVVGGDRFGLAGLADHKELRQDCHRLQVDGECPKDLMRERFPLNMQRNMYSHSDNLIINETGHRRLNSPLGERSRG